jgi:hypothetical protein
MSYAQLYNLASPFLKSYRDDLEKHDKAAIEAHSGCPYLHYTRESGTHILFLIPAKEYPREGDRVPFLFGFADRWHLLKELVSAAEHWLRPCNTRPLLTLWFDGKKFHQITVDKALDIARAYRIRIESEWRKVPAYV